MIDNKIYKFFAEFVFNKTGIFYPEKDYYRLDSRINKLMSEYDCGTAEEVFEKFKNGRTPEMEKFLINICTNNETYFFRDDKPFKALANDMIPEIQASYPGQKVKIWSCASSTGQEPLSIIMSLLEKFGY